MEFEPRERITDGTRTTMLFVAIAFWTFSFIPIINIFSNTVAWIIFWMWFKIRGAGLNKKLAMNASSFIVGYIPLIGTLLSAFPYVIYRNIKAVQVEDAEYNASIEKTLLAQRIDAQEAYEQMLYEEEMAAAEEQQQVTISEEDEEKAARRERAYAYAEADETEGKIRKIGREDSFTGALLSAQADEREKNNQVNATTSGTYDALDELNNKEMHSREDNIKLQQARHILTTGAIDSRQRGDPVLQAAWNKHNTGVREYNPITNPRGFKFKNANYM